MAAISLEKALSRLRLLTPGARFFQSGQVNAQPSGPEENAPSFHYVSLYEHRIGTSVRSIGGFMFLIANGFLSSHAYNLALAWLWHRRAGGGALDAALRHNYKKFFAERAIAHRSCLIGRSMLIETLLYEEALMKPIFDALPSDEPLRKLASDIASTTTRLASLHELAHLFLRRSRADFTLAAQGYFDGSLGKAIDRVGTGFGSELAEEVLCDAFAAHQGVTSPEFPLAGYDPITRARITAFAFLVFADLIALEASAIATAEASEAEDLALVDLASEKRPKTPVPFKVGRMPSADLRAAEVVGLLDGHVRRGQGNAKLYGDDGAFPFPESTRAELLSTFERFGDLIEPVDAGMTGTDAHRRGLAQLVAESLHGHPSGAEFLLWRTKRFSVGGEPIDP